MLSYLARDGRLVDEDELDEAFAVALTHPRAAADRSGEFWLRCVKTGCPCSRREDG